MWPFETVDRYR